VSQTLDVLVIRGAPGAGKSTLGRGLRRALTSGAVLEVDDFRGMLCQVDWASRDDHDVALDVALEAVRVCLAHERRPVILIDTFSRSRLKSVLEHLTRSDLHHRVLSLWVDPTILELRLEARTSGFNQWEPSRILNEEVLTNRYPEERFVDATLLDRVAVVELAVACVARQDEEGQR
jgi:hypothetical protein